MRISRRAGHERGPLTTRGLVMPHCSLAKTLSRCAPSKTDKMARQEWYGQKSSDTAGAGQRPALTKTMPSRCHLPCSHLPLGLLPRRSRLIVCGCLDWFKIPKICPARPTPGCPNQTRQRPCGGGSRPHWSPRQVSRLPSTAGRLVVFLCRLTWNSVLFVCAARCGAHRHGFPFSSSNSAPADGAGG